jgi:hypothetical protein
MANLQSVPCPKQQSNGCNWTKPDSEADSAVAIQKKKFLRLLQAHGRAIGYHCPTIVAKK